LHFTEPIVPNTGQPNQTSTISTRRRSVLIEVTSAAVRNVYP